MSDIYSDLKALASKHGSRRSWRTTSQGKVTLSHIRLMDEPATPGFARLVIHDQREPPRKQYLVEVERLRALIDHPAS